MDKIEFHGFEVLRLNGLGSHLEALTVNQRNDERLNKVIEYVKNG